MQEIAILIPIWNDWPSARRVLTALDRVALSLPRHRLCVFFVDDGSHTRCDPLLHASLQGLHECAVLELYGNFGHQKALAAGLGSLFSKDRKFDGYLFMDGDGEDRPEAVRILLEEALLHPGAAIAAARSSRAESLFFRLGYALYQWLFFLIAGRKIRFGNFFYAPASAAEMLATKAETGIHLAASLLHSGFPIRELPLPRGARLEGKSKMSRASLILHGLRALGVFHQSVRSRAFALLACSGFLFFTLALTSVWQGSYWLAGIAMALLFQSTALALWLFSAPATARFSLLPLLEGPQLVRRTRWIRERRPASLSRAPEIRVDI